MLRLLLCNILAVLLSPLAPGQDATDILKKTTAAYKSLMTYDFEQVELTEFPGSRHTSEMRQRFAGAPGGKMRNEALPKGGVSIWDGEYYWSYSPQRNEFTKRPSHSTFRFLPDYDRIGWRVKAARILREEEVQLETEPVACYVIETEHINQLGEEQQQMPSTYWVDKTRFLVLKQRRCIVFNPPGRVSSEMITTISIVKLSVNEPVPDSLFRFDPPDGAVQVEELAFGSKSPLDGKSLPDFEAKDLAGSLISAASLRGSLAVLYFGPGPSSPDDLLPFAELLHQKYKGRGVAVVNIITHGNRDSATDLTKFGYTLPTVLDSDGALSRNLGVSYTGVLVADRDGRIVYSSAGAHGAAKEIIRTIRQAGLW